MVRAAHCNCMAGLGESCSHIAATLFAVSAAANLVQGQTCTSMPCKWTQPSEEAVKASLYLKGSDIEFSHRKPHPENDNTPKQPNERKVDSQKLFEALHEAEKNEEKPVQSAILAFVPGHSHRYIPRQATMNIPPPLTELYKAENLKLSHRELVTKSEEILEALTVTEEQVKSPTQTICFSTLPHYCFFK